MFQSVRESSAFIIAASEETPVETMVGSDEGTGDSGETTLYSLGFDPLDGSSIIDANFSVGSIFGVCIVTSK